MQRSGPRTVVKSTSVFACFEPLGGPCSCLMKQNSCAKNRSTPLDRLSEAIPCEVLAYLCLREQESFLTPHIAPASRAIDASPSLSLSGSVTCIRLMLCLSFYERGCIHPGEQMILAPFLEKSCPDRAPGRFADYLFVPKHPKADVLLTTVLGPLRRAATGHTDAGGDPPRPMAAAGFKNAGDNIPAPLLARHARRRFCRRRRRRRNKWAPPFPAAPPNTQSRRRRYRRLRKPATPHGHRRP